MNISSVAGLKGSPGSFAYAATKWALRGMTKSAAIDLGDRKIRMNSVHSGPIDTDMIAFRTPRAARGTVQASGCRCTATERRRRSRSWLAFLLSDESSYITGAEIAIDGASSSLAPVMQAHVRKFRGLRLNRLIRLARHWRHSR